MYGLKRVNHLLAAAAAAASYRKPLLRSVPIRHYPAGIDRKRRKWLAKELSKSVTKLTCESSANGGVCNVYLVGSNHTSPESWEEVRAVVKFFKPEVVFLELCSSRKHVLTLENREAPTMRATMREMVDMWKRNERLSWILYQGYNLMCYNPDEDVDGGDFRAAYEEAVKCGAKVILGDRPDDITEQRYWAKTSLLDVLVPKDIDLPEEIVKKLRGKFDARSVDIVIKETAKKYPIEDEIFRLERDLYMSAKLLEVGREHSSVVAVVGKSHVPGIKKNWKKPVDVEQLLSIPSEKKPITVERLVLNIRAIVVMATTIWRTMLMKMKK